MKSKKINLEIVNKFIDECVENNICSPEQIINEAKKQIQDIDFEMFKILKLKNKKIELLETINFFSEFKEKENKFIFLKDNKIIKEICEKIKFNENVKDYDSNLLKKLIEYEILSIKNNKIILGKEYDNYELSTKNG